MKIWAMAVLVCVGSFGAGCRKGGGEDDMGAGADGGKDVLSADERDAVDRGGEGVPAIQQAAVIADSLFAFDPTLDPQQTDTQNAGLVEARARDQLGMGDGGGPGCGTVTLSGTTVTVSFGPAPGCTMKSGAVVSGSLSAYVTKMSGSLTVLLAFTNLVVNGTDLGGTASFKTMSGNIFTVDANLSSGPNTFTATGFTITGAPGTITVDGAVSSQKGDVKTTLTFASVRWKLGECYPNMGTLTARKGLLSATLTFLPTTPTTGTVNVTIAGKTTTAALPVYGSCGA